MKAKTVRTEVTLQNVISAQRSITGRRSRMRKMNRRWGGGQDTPIQAIGVFDEEITEMEKALEKMQSRIDNAKILI